MSFAAAGTVLTNHHSLNGISRSGATGRLSYEKFGVCWVTLRPHMLLSQNARKERGKPESFTRRGIKQSTSMPCDAREEGKES